MHNELYSVVRKNISDQMEEVAPIHDRIALDILNRLIQNASLVHKILFVGSVGCFVLVL